MLALLDTGARPDTLEQTERRRMLMRLASEGRFDEIPGQAFPIYVHPNRHSDGGLKRAVGEMAESTGPDAYLRQQQAILRLCKFKRAQVGVLTANCFCRLLGGVCGSGASAAISVARPGSNAIRMLSLGGRFDRALSRRRN
ncbi:MAG TPA: hypothetical protein VFM10_01375 [Terriglobales bacterium]|nr:hypothetical protein [Terriglobales bacterium]